MILHLDMDAFFASVEQLENPALRGKPVIIGGGDRGVVATASYEARVYGIHSAMPVATARKLCPNGIFIHGRHQRYSEISASIMAALRNFSPVVQKASIDEAYLDLSGTAPENIRQTGRQIKQAVASASGGLSCSVGIAPVKFLAKICSDLDKPNGLFVLTPENVDEFLLRQPVSRLPGVGRHMQEKLKSFGILTVQDLRNLSLSFMRECFGKWGEVLHARAHGIDPRQVHENEPAKSEGSEHTFARDTRDRMELREALLRHADRVGSRLRKNQLAGRTITLKVKFENFAQITRSRTIESRTSETRTIYNIACQLLSALELPHSVRLIGISVSGFEPRPEQLPLPLRQTDEAERECSWHGAGTGRAQNIDSVLDSVRSRFGKTSLRLAATLVPKEGCHHFVKNTTD